MSVEIEVGLENATKMPPVIEELSLEEKPIGLANPKLKRLLIGGGAVVLAMIAGLFAYYRNRETTRSEEHTSELQSQSNLVCRLLLEKKKKHSHTPTSTHLRRSPPSPHSFPSRAPTTTSPPPRSCTRHCRPRMAFPTPAPQPPTNPLK